MENQNSIYENQNNKPIQVNFDDFNISEDSFKPVNKGLGFHQEQKKQTAFKPTPPVKQILKQSTTSLLNEISKSNQEVTSKVVPSGLEAFYGAPSATIQNQIEITNNALEAKLDLFEEKTTFETATLFSQLFAWMIDLLLVVSFVAITTTMLVLVSGMSFQAFSRVVSIVDIGIFTSVLFSIYYLLYFTILDLSVSPGKTILGIKLVRTDNKEVTVKNTFIRSVVSLLSFVALFLPMVIDFQGRLSDTKVVK